ncbi:tetratricopeptide repeat protein [Candidatus Falkowbacteria bacterium]|nr:tetratricopeptide repeat protein [Candidatus Falkowbacteria bacterium]
MVRKILNNIDFWLLAAFMALLPIYFMPAGLSNHIGFVVNLAVDRVVLLKIFVSTISLIVLSRVIYERKIRLGVSPKKLLVFLPFFFAVMIATLFSIDKQSSLYGFYWRQMGMITQLFFLALILLFFLIINTRERLEKMMSVVAFSSFFVAVYAIFQWSGIDFLNLQKIPDTRSSSTLGQPVFLGNFLVLTLLPAIYKAIKSEKFYQRTGFALIAVVQFWALVTTYSRGAWLGAGFAVLLLLSYNVVGKKNYFPVKKLLITVLIIFSFFSLVVAKNPDFFKYKEGRGPLFLQRILSSFDFSGGSTSLRLSYWKGALELIKKNPLIGTGPETQHILFLDFFSPSWAEKEDVNSLSDRAHNEFLDITLNAGVLGICSYLLFLLMVILIIAKTWSRKHVEEKKDWLIPVLCAALLGYWVEVFFSFSIIETNALFWFYLYALILAFDPAAVEYNLQALRRFRFVSYFALIVFLLVYVDLVWGSVNCVRADFEYARARSRADNNSRVSTYNHYFKAIDYNPNEEFYRNSYIIDLISSNPELLSLGEGDEGKITNLNLAKQILDLDQGLQPNYYRSLRKAVVFSAFSNSGDKQMGKTAEESFLELIKRYPNMPEPYYQLGRLYKSEKKLEQAASSVKSIFPLLPPLDSDKMNEEHRQKLKVYLAQRYLFLGDVYAELGDLQESNKYMFMVLESSPYFVPAYEKIGWNYYKLKNYELAIKYYKRAFKMNPKEYRLALQLGKIYLSKGDKASSLPYFKTALSLNKGDKELEKLINDIPK